MALNIKNAVVERLAQEVAEMTGESKTEAIRRALEERKSRLSLLQKRDRGAMLRRTIDNEIWSQIPPELLGKGIPQDEQDEILGYGPDGV